jgi:hypothetical protein
MKMNTFVYYLLVDERSSFLSTLLEFDVKPFVICVLYCIENFFLSMSLLEVMSRLTFTAV